VIPNKNESQNNYNTYGLFSIIYIMNVKKETYVTVFETPHFYYLVNKFDNPSDIIKIQSLWRKHKIRKYINLHLYPVLNNIVVKYLF